MSHICKLCNKSFIHQPSLSRHMKIHKSSNIQFTDHQDIQFIYLKGKIQNLSQLTNIFNIQARELILDELQSITNLVKNIYDNTIEEKIIKNPTINLDLNNNNNMSFINFIIDKHPNIEYFRNMIYQDPFSIVENKLMWINELDHNHISPIKIEDDSIFIWNNKWVEVDLYKLNKCFGTIYSSCYMTLMNQQMKDDVELFKNNPHMDDKIQHIYYEREYIIDAEFYQKMDIYNKTMPNIKSVIQLINIIKQ